jgi:hypothetical protein
VVDQEQLQVSCVRTTMPSVQVVVQDAGGLG